MSPNSRHPWEHSIYHKWEPAREGLNYLMVNSIVPGINAQYCALVHTCDTRFWVARCSFNICSGVVGYYCSACTSLLASTGKTFPLNFCLCSRHSIHNNLVYRSGIQEPNFRSHSIPALEHQHEHELHSKSYSSRHYSWGAWTSTSNAACCRWGKIRVDKVLGAVRDRKNLAGFE